MTGQVEGLDTVLNRLNTEISGIKRRGSNGLMAAGLKVQGTSQKRVPVDTGNLKGSAFTRYEGPRRDAVLIGYTAAYALFVHENLEQKLEGQKRSGGKGSYWETGQPKFLESALRDEEGEIIDTIKRYAQVQG